MTQPHSATRPSQASMPHSPAQEVQDARHIQHLTQADLADMAGVDVRSIKRLESGIKVSANTIRAVCAALKLDAAQLVPMDSTAPTDVTPNLLESKPASTDASIVDLYRCVRQRRLHPKYHNIQATLSKNPLDAILKMFGLLSCVPLAIVWLYLSGNQGTDAYLQQHGVPLLFVVNGLGAICAFLWITGCYVCLFGGRASGYYYVTETRIAVFGSLPWIVLTIDLQILKSNLSVLVSHTVVYVGMLAIVVGYIMLLKLQARDQRRAFHAAHTALQALLSQPVTSAEDIREAAHQAQLSIDATVYPQVGKAFIPLVWLHEDIKIGLVSPSSAPLYIALAQDAARELCATPKDPANIVSPPTPRPVLSLEERFDCIRNRAIAYIEQQVV